MLEDNPDCIRMEDDRGNGLVAIAAMSNVAECLYLVLDSGADVNHANHGKLIC